MHTTFNRIYGPASRFSNWFCIVLKPISSRQESEGNFKFGWNYWLQDTVLKTKKHLEKA